MKTKIFRKFYIMLVVLLAVGGIFYLLPNKSEGVDESPVAVVSAEETIAGGLTWAEQMSAVASTYSLDGDGSYEKPYLIENATDLAYMAYMVNEGDSGSSEKYWSLEADIDLSGALWTPIGLQNDDNDKFFTGCFWGNGYTISNITITNESLVYETD